MKELVKGVEKTIIMVLDAAPHPLLELETLEHVAVRGDDPLGVVPLAVAHQLVLALALPGTPQPPPERAQLHPVGALLLVAPQPGAGAGVEAALAAARQPHAGQELVLVVGLDEEGAREAAGAHANRRPTCGAHVLAAPVAPPGAGAQIFLALETHKYRRGLHELFGPTEEKIIGDVARKEMISGQKNDNLKNLQADNLF
ncbi:hypothetical protein TcasGA2_TC013198 [Tribolium castaneum]|uniref:Uncharacterized protein n=1 Tax=Tribolium castaneum TaxID=7070 RepID=D6WMY8_TRICA|nr:hypothetical protein TcasGA2_TC013198 [Tribolium castaneum]